MTTLPPSDTRVSWFRRIAKLWGFAAFCLGVVILFRGVALPFLFAILVAYILAPIVDHLTQRRVWGWQVPRVVAVLGCYVVLVGLIVLFFTAFLPRLWGDLSRVFREAPAVVRRVHEEYVPAMGKWLDRYLGEEHDLLDSEPEAPAEDPTALAIEQVGPAEWRINLRGMELEVKPYEGGYLVGPRPPQAWEAPGERWERSLKRWLAGLAKASESQLKQAFLVAQSLLTGIVQALAGLVLVLMVAAFILVDLERIRQFSRSLVPSRYRADFDIVLEGVNAGLAGVIRGQFTICVVNGVLTWLGLVLFGVKYAVLLGVVAAIMSLIPVFGSILSSIPIVATALASGPHGFSLWTGLAVLGWICGIHLLEANVLNPKIMGSAAKIHPVVVIFALLAGEKTYGLVGALFAVPVASIVQTVFLFFKKRTWPVSQVALPAVTVAPPDGKIGGPPGSSL